MVSGTLSLVRGDDTDIGVTVYQSDGVTAYDLTSCAITLTVRQNTYFSQVVLTVVGTLVDAVNGIAKFTLVPADTDNFADTPYYFDVKLLDAAAKTTTLISGTLTMQPQ